MTFLYYVAAFVAGVIVRHFWTSIRVKIVETVKRLWTKA